VGRARPDVIVHQLTSLAGVERYTQRDAAPTNRLRTEGTDHLLSAGQAVGVRRFVAQGLAGFGAYARSGGPVKSERRRRGGGDGGRDRARRSRRVQRGRR
jgi:hypothetical protein